MTNILIPTDFSTDSFKLVEQAVKYMNTEVNIVLFHAYEMPFYIQDMVRSERPPYYNMMNDSFRQQCRQLKSQYPKLINRISFQYMQGNTVAVFRNFAEAQQIDLIVCPENYVYVKNHPRSLNPVPFFKKSRLPLLVDLVPAKQAVDTIIQKKEYAFATA